MAITFVMDLRAPVFRDPYSGRHMVDPRAPLFGGHVPVYLAQSARLHHDVWRSHCPSSLECQGVL
eukprot:3128441-Rhodomonas_salina.1